MISSRKHTAEQKGLMDMVMSEDEMDRLLGFSRQSENEAETDPQRRDLEMITELAAQHPGRKLTAVQQQVEDSISRMAQRSSAEQAKDTDADLFGEAVDKAYGRLPFSAQLSAEIAAADAQHGSVSQRLGVDAGEHFGNSNRGLGQASAGSAQRQLPDVSRGLDSAQPQPSAPALQPQRSAEPAVTASQPKHESQQPSREPVKVSQVVRETVSRLESGEKTAEKDEGPQPG